MNTTLFHLLGGGRWGVGGGGPAHTLIQGMKMALPKTLNKWSRGLGFRAGEYQFK